MYLKSLDIQGFKSFANKTTIEFHRGVTAIVGPNGCGKSNVLDSIRWVLGEQSAKALRGGEMADVIFSGTDSRQAVGMAEVTMTFAECEQELGLDYHEVQITRRVFRDGRSEYFLNKTGCRLRDIQMLFMDTGIGRSAYSIMEQGKIDQILSSRPEDRRAIFEEAAGITKYKSQKKEALRKLESTEANLVRLTDIMKEVKRQIGSLQRQAGKARRYQALLEDLRILDTHLSRRRFDELDAEIRELDTEIGMLTERHAEAEERAGVQETVLVAKKEELTRMELRINEARDRVQTLKNDISSGESRIGFNRERMAEFANLVARYKIDLESGEEKLAWQESQITETDQQIEDASTVLADEERNLATQSSAVAALREKRIAAEQSLRQSDMTLSQSEGRSNTLRAELATLQGQHEATESRSVGLAQEIAAATESRDKAAEALASSREQKADSENRLNEARRDLREIEESLKIAQAAFQTVEREVSQAQRLVAEDESRLGVLRQLVEEGAGLGGGTQAVLKGLDDPSFYKPALLGSLASHIETEPEFVTAIEAAVGSHLQTVLLKETELAPKIFGTLIAKKQGRAALAPTEFLGSNTGTPREFLPEGALAWALDKIKVQGPAVSLIHRLLSRTVVVATLDDALRLKSTNPDLTFATLDGTIVTLEGVILGGQTADSGNSVLSRRNQIKDLEAKLATSRGALTEAESRRISASETLEETRVQLQTHRDIAQESQFAVSAFQSQVTTQERESRDLENKLRNLEWERANIEKRRDSASGSILQIELQLAELAALIETHMSRRSELQSSLEQAREEENRLSDTLNEARIRVATERQRQENLRRQRDPMAARVAELRDLIAQRRNDIAAYAERIGTLEAEINGITERVAKSRDSLGSAERVVAELIHERVGMVDVIASIDTEVRALRKAVHQSQEERGDREVRRTKLGLKLDNIVEHIQRRYQIDLREFRIDAYAFNVAVRDLKKKRTQQDVPAPPAPRVESDSTDHVAPISSHTEEVLPGTVLNGAIVPVVDESDEEQPTATFSSGEEFDWGFVENTVAEMTERVDAMGPVNLDAIQEFDELEQRQKFLDEQNNDLTNSKAELLDAIAKINHTTKQLFADTFEQVRTNFQEMFTELFGGGKANLLLADDSDPLESGIDIIARPPGKQLQSISLLSGGEKTMTAVALLFSIYMVKPSPFCVLDEMDAPLDESNINRFIKILDRFVAQSQFVVITHNKRTIAKADVLYGVTMEEHGVSKLVGVKLTKRAESHENADLIGTASRQPDSDTSDAIPSVAESFGKHGNLHSETVAR